MALRRSLFDLYFRSKVIAVGLFFVFLTFLLLPKRQKVNPSLGFRGNPREGFIFRNSRTARISKKLAVAWRLDGLFCHFWPNAQNGRKNSQSRNATGKFFGEFLKKFFRKFLKIFVENFQRFSVGKFRSAIFPTHQKIKNFWRVGIIFCRQYDTLEALGASGP